MTSLFVLAAGLGDRSSDQSVDTTAGPERTHAAPAWDVELALANEPGRRLVLEGKARRAAGRDSLPGFVFYVYQADARGRYGPPGPDSEKPRLAGFVKADDRGMFRIRTILPGTYGGPPHLHFEFRDSLGAMRTKFINLFPPLEGDYAAYGDGFPHNFRRPKPGLNSTEVSGPLGRLLITQPADLDILPDSTGTFFIRWDLVLSRSAPHPTHPGWGSKAPR